MELYGPFSDLTSDVLFLLAGQLELPELLSFCSASKKINDTICRKDNIWYYKLEKEFPNWRTLLNDETSASSASIKNPKTLQPITTLKTPKDIYILLYWYNIFKILKEKLKIEEDIYKIFSLQYLYLGNNKITEIPAEIGKLSNLQILYLENNEITEIPPEIGSLSNLQELYLQNNQITEIPKEIGQLSNLQRLDLENNSITEIPKEIKEKLPHLNIYL